MTMRPSCTAVFWIAVMLVEPAAANAAGWEIAKFVEENAEEMCSTMTVAMPKCIVGMGIVSVTLGLVDVCWQTHQSTVLAQLDYGYFTDDIEHMNAYLTQMNTYIMQYKALIEIGNATSFRVLMAYNMNVLENGKNFIEAVSRAIKHEREMDRPTFNPFYGVWCLIRGCPYLPAGVDEDLVNIRRDMKLALPNIELLQSLAKLPLGEKVEMEKVNADLKSQLKQISQHVQMLTATLRSQDPIMFLTGMLPEKYAGTNEGVSMALAQSFMSFRGLACSDFTCWADRSTLLGKKLRQWQTSMNFNMHMAMLSGFVTLVAVVGVAQRDTTQTLLARTRVSPQPQQGFDDRHDAPLLGNGPHYTTKPLQVTGVLVALAVLIAVFSGIFAWSWAAYLQLNNQIAIVDRFATLSGSMQVALDAAAACGHTCPTASMADFLKTMSDQGALALKMMINNAEDALQSSKLI